MAIEFTVILREPGHEQKLVVSAATHGDAAHEAMTFWVAKGQVGVDQMPLEVVTRTTFIEPHAQRFIFEAPPAFVQEKMHACRECGCSEYDACDPPCSWVSDDVCNAPTCVAAAGLQ